VLWVYLQREVGIEGANLRLLHVAPDAIASALRSRPNIRFVGIDISPLRRPEVVGDLTRAPLASATFDLILCSHVLEHVQDDLAAMREITRLLSPTGRGIVLIPWDHSRASTDEDPTVTDPRERIRRFGQHNHVRRYGRDIVDRLWASGLQVDSLDYAASLSSGEREQMALGHAVSEKAQLFVCRPRAFVGTS